MAGTKVKRIDEVEDICTGIFSAVMTLKPIMDRMLSQSGRQDEPSCMLGASHPANQYQLLLSISLMS